MAIFKCKMCGGTLEISDNQSTAVCEYCGTKQTLPKLDDEKRANLYERANHFRRNNEFDKAAAIYEQILNEDGSDAEAYWSLVLCRYGIQYVEDPASRKRVPTVNRAQFTSIFDDDNYKSALQYADDYQKSIYEEEAKAINEIQKGILAISQNEEPFDVFICYKETDNSGCRTHDSVLANDLYHQLTQEGYKVFFSRITLEDKLGVAYEPYIFAALNSAKVMVVLGTKPEYFNAVWVKNEWSRYLALVKASNGKKILIPAYRDMDPYDLPEEFSHLQAQDMSKLGFMQDLIRGIKKLVTADSPAIVKETVVMGGNTAVEPLLERAFIYLEDGEWENADEYCEKVLDSDPKNASAYLGKLMAELKCRKKEHLKEQPETFESNGNYIKALRFADERLSAELKGYNAYIKNISYEKNIMKNDNNNELSNKIKCKKILSILSLISLIPIIGYYVSQYHHLINSNRNQQYYFEFFIYLLFSSLPYVLFFVYVSMFSKKQNSALILSFVFITLQSPCIVDFIHTIRVGNKLNLDLFMFFVSRNLVITIINILLAINVCKGFNKKYLVIISAVVTITRLILDFGEYAFSIGNIGNIYLIGILLFYISVIVFVFKNNIPKIKFTKKNGKE